MCIIKNLYSIETGNFKLDGGAMFGVVPKTIWEKTNPADDLNMIQMAARSLLIETNHKLILIDAGLGDKQSEKFFSHYYMWGEYSLDASIKKAGFKNGDITDVFFTHLHFDHCGGAIIRKSGELVPRFENANFWVNKDHWEWAISPNSREKASFLTDNILPLQESGKLHLIGAGEKPLGFDILTVNGHTEKMMLPILEFKNKTLVFVSDLIPTAGHIRVPFIMGYDTRPLLTLQEKTSFLEKAAKEKFLLFLQHDVKNEVIDIRRENDRFKLNKTFKLEDI
ncbi:MBL fold metallo-hydrolase [Bacteroidota bacterium]|nr:MBL fold metallo-hydrolase [Bacteroidota bacterium]